MSDSSSSLTLKWEKVNDWFARTTDQQFRCRRFFTGGDVIEDPGVERYQLYGPHGERIGPPCSRREVRKYLEAYRK